jgi:hypothetical protein
VNAARYVHTNVVARDWRRLARFRLLGADSWLIDARALWKRASEAMERDGRFFVERMP